MKIFDGIDLKNGRLPVIVAVVMSALILVAAVIGVVLFVQNNDDSSVAQEKEEVVEAEQEIREEVPAEVEAEAEQEVALPEEEILPEQEPEQIPAETVAEQLPEAEDDSWMLILANPWNTIPEDFNVELSDIGGGQKVDSRIVNDLNAMMNDLKSAGHSAFVCSSYRTNTKQTTLYTNKVNSYRSQGYADEDAAVEAAKWVAIPGTSEHQTGLAVDIMSSYYLELDEGQENTAEQQWLMQNSYKYGFILRYPNNKTEITGIYYEPWHYRYVGVEAATEMFEKGICFEEYLLG